MQTDQSPIPPKPKKLLDQVRDAIRTKPYSYRNKPSFLVSSHAQLRNVTPTAVTNAANLALFMVDVSQLFHKMAALGRIHPVKEPVSSG